MKREQAAHLKSRRGLPGWLFHWNLKHITKRLILRVLLNGGGHQGHPICKRRLNRRWQLRLLLLFKASRTVGKRLGQTALEVPAAGQHGLDVGFCNVGVPRPLACSATDEAHCGHGGGPRSGPPARVAVFRAGRGILAAIRLAAGAVVYTAIVQIIFITCTGAVVRKVAFGIVGAVRVTEHVVRRIECG